MARAAITPATTRSGQLRPVPNTPSAASITATLLNASLRVHSHTPRMLASPSRQAYSSRATPTLAASASRPTEPMVSASGVMPCHAPQATRPITNTPKASMLAPLSSAALARHCSAMASTRSDTP